jgi:hypothetical protein
MIYLLFITVLTQRIHKYVKWEHELKHVLEIIPENRRSKSIQIYEYVSS